MAHVLVRGLDRRGTRVTAVAGVLLVALAALLGTTALVTGAEGSGAPRCERFRAAAELPADHVDRTDPVDGRRVLVLGDSWSAGLGLQRPATSWPSRLTGRVHVASYSGSGFSALASDCGREHAYDRRAAAALARVRSGPGAGPDLVVVQGGLNDFNQGDRAVRAGFERLMRVLEPRRAAYDVVVVGPAAAPARAPWVPHLDALLAGLCATHGVGYVSTLDLALPYLPDNLHLTRAGHRIFGEAVADRISALPG